MHAKCRQENIYLIDISLEFSPLHLIVILSFYLFFCRAVKNGKGVHSKKDHIPHRVSEISNVRMNVQSYPLIH